MSTQHEQVRLRALRELNLLDTAPSESFDRVTRMASQLFDAPIAAVSLTDEDRQWFKSRVGCPVAQLPRRGAPCAEVTRAGELVVVPDLATDARFSNSPVFEMGARFYAGAPLMTVDGFCLGAMCVLDNKPRTITAEQGKLLTDLAAMVMAQIELQHALGRIDPVSGVPNRNQFGDDIEDLARDQPNARRIAVLVDLVDLRQLEDTLRVLGPAFLDDLVTTARDTIRSILGKSAPVYHVGATHYAFLLEDLTDEALQSKIAEIHTRLKTFVHSNGIPVATNAAIGIAPFRLGAMTARDLLRTAHAAAQDARASELQIATYSSARDEAHQRRFTLLTAFREAAADEGQQLSLVYQPRIDMRSGAFVSAEVLLRWNHPILGSISPGEFVPLVEPTALVSRLTDWVLDHALAQIAEWQASGLGVRLSVNVSAANLEEEDFVSRLGAKLQCCRVPPQALELEFTESALIRNRTRVLVQLEELRAMGVGSAIDDFGTGYSSFAYLQNIPADLVKIDKSFMRALPGDERDCALVKAMIAMSHDLGYRVVAEGIEAEDVYDFLAACGCDEAQGYFISRPISAGALALWLAERRRPRPAPRRRASARMAARAAG